MRDPGEPTRLEDREAGRDADRRQFGRRAELAVGAGLRLAALRVLAGHIVLDRPPANSYDRAFLDDLSAWLDRPVKLVAAESGPGTFENPLDVDEETDWVSWQSQPGSFHDGRSTVSLVSLDSLGDHERRRFRINLVLDGDGEDELVGNDVAIGCVRLHIRKPIDRCIMVARAQPGIPADLQVLKRVIRERGNLMGVGATVVTRGEIAEKTYPL